MYECSFESHPSPNSDTRYLDRSASWGLVHSKLQGQKKKKKKLASNFPNPKFENTLLGISPIQFGLGLEPQAEIRQQHDLTEVLSDK